MIIDNVTFAYVKIQSPVAKYQSADTEFTVDCIVSKAQAKAWNKEFPKQKAKEVDNEEFEAKYKIPPVFEDQDSQYVIKVKKPHIKNGKELPATYRPRVFERIGDKNVDVTFDKLPANGSFGQLSYSVRTNDFGTFSQLNSILITKMIEYKSKAGTGSDFGEVELKEAPVGQAPVVKQDEGVKKSAAKVEKQPEDDFNEDAPF